MNSHARHVSELAPPAGWTISVDTVVTAFFATGLMTVLLESIFFQVIANLAEAGLGTRALLGFHLYFSEMWFLLGGNLLAALIIVRRGMTVPRRLVAAAIPIFIVLGVYSAAFLHGIFAGNVGAVREFREIVFGALSLPGMLYLASLIDFRRVLEKFIAAGIWILLPFSFFGAHGSVLIISAVFISYYSFFVLHGKRFSLLRLFVAFIPFIAIFLKPMIALVTFSLVTSFFLAGYYHRPSRNWILSRFKLKMLVMLLGVFLLLLTFVFFINFWFGGIIEDAIRYYFMKERVNSTTGAIRYGDWSGGRIGIWTAAIESWVQRPFFGYGLGAPVQAYASGWVVKTQFHNYLIQALHNSGAIGFAAIGSSLIYWFRASVRGVKRIGALEPRILAASVLVGIFGVGFFGLYGHPLSYPPATQFFWLSVAYISLLQVEQRSRPVVLEYAFLRTEL